MAHGILAQSYMDLPATPMFLAITIRYLIVIFNPMANLDFGCFRKESSGEGGASSTMREVPLSMRSFPLASFDFIPWMIIPIIEGFQIVLKYSKTKG